MNLLGPTNKKEKQQQQLMIVLLLCATGYYFFVYLPDQERKHLKMTIQETIRQVSQAQPQDYSSLLTTCQGYLR